MWTIPNLLTFLRLCLVPVFVVASMRGMYTTAFVIFLSAAATDILDGYIARRFNMRSRFGALLDPAVDKTMMVTGFVFYTFAPSLPLVRIPVWLTFVVFIRDLLIAIFAYLLYTRVQIKRFPPTWAGKASTVLQAATLCTTIAVNAFLPGLLGLAEWLFRVSLVATLYSGWDYLRRGELWLREPVAAQG
jgi:cardiolipin synthase (CMP-forming)